MSGRGSGWRPGHGRRWDVGRPRWTAWRRRAARLGTLLARAALTVATATVLMVLAGAVLPPLLEEYGYQPERDAAAWSALTPSYATSASCRRCHGIEATAVRLSRHEGVACESCHGPLEAHSAVVTRAAAAAVKVVDPPRSICSTCHEQVTGRPATFPQVRLARHYEGAECAQCHGVHEIVAQVPPIVTHPLRDLPGCVVCHAPAGIRTLPAAHRPADDDTCLSCHASDRHLDAGGLGR